MSGNETHTVNASPASSAPTYSETDVRFYRATFKTRYPKENLILTDKKSLEVLKIIELNHKKHVQSDKHVHLAVKEAKIDNVSWDRCRFHWPEDTKISDCKLQNCDFERCFFGSVEFNRITFRDCKFTKCEFSFARFIECNFENCTWEDCTLWDAHFQGSLINPDEILKGFCIPKENFTSLKDAVISERIKMLLRSRVDLAEQLSRSNDERRNALYSDRSMSAYRRETIKLRRDRRGEIPIHFRWLHWIRDMPSLIFFYLTNGGVSLNRLLLLALSSILGLSLIFYLNKVDILFRNTQLHDNPGKCLEASLALLLAFGYEQFTTSDPKAFPSHIVAVPILGVFWLSLTLAVVIRRVYR